MACVCLCFDMACVCLCVCWYGACVLIWHVCVCVCVDVCVCVCVCFDMACVCLCVCLIWCVCLCVLIWHVCVCVCVGWQITDGLWLDRQKEEKEEEERKRKCERKVERLMKQKNVTCEEAIDQPIRRKATRQPITGGRLLIGRSIGTAKSCICMRVLYIRNYWKQILINLVVGVYALSENYCKHIHTPLEA